MDLGDLAALAEWRRIGSDHSDPDVLRALLLDPVLFPFCRSTAPPVIGGNDEGGPVAIGRPGLQPLPELGDEMIEEVCAVEHQVVAAGVCPVVGLTVPNE